MQIICFVAFSLISKTTNLIHGKVSNFWSPPPTDLSFSLYRYPPQPKKSQIQEIKFRLLKEVVSESSHLLPSSWKPRKTLSTSSNYGSLTLTKKINSRRNLIRHGHTEEFIPIEIIVLRHEPPSRFVNFSNFIHYRDTTNDPFAQLRLFFSEKILFQCLNISWSTENIPPSVIFHVLKLCFFIKMSFPINTSLHHQSFLFQDD